MSEENVTPLYKAAFDKLPAEKKERILRIATEEFANNGFENAAIQEIAKKADISVGSIYKYFDNKETLFSLVVQDGLTTLENFLMELADSSEDILKKAEVIIRGLLDFSRENPNLIKLYCRLTAGENSRFLNRFSQHIEAISASIYTSVISEAQETGEVRGDIDPSFFAFLLDNILMMLQFSTTCDYYKERFIVYTGRDSSESDEVIVEQTLKFLKAAFNFK